MAEIDKLGWIHIKNKQLLGARSKGKTMFYVPGGKREKGETDQAALCREIKEELSVDLIPSSIKYLETFTDKAHDKPNGTTVKVTCYLADFNGKIVPNAEIETVAWLNYQNRHQCSQVMQLVMDWLKSQNLIE